MRELVLTPKFKRAFRNCVKGNTKLQERIKDTLIQMQQDVFATKLGTHRLAGKLQGLQACSCGYNCRVIFSVETDRKSGREVIVLLDVGTHDEVY